MPLLRRFFSWFSRTFTTLLCIYTLLAYIFGYTLWVNHWLIGFMLLTVPWAMLGCLLMAIWFLIRRHSKRAIFPTVVLVLGFPFILRTITWHSTEAIKGVNSFKVLSYNAMFFDIDAVSKRAHSDAMAEKMIKWVNEFDADVKCFQEFYNWRGQERFKKFNTTDQLTKQGYKYQIFTQAQTVDTEGLGFVGLAIFSKYPLIFRRELMFSTVGNGCLIADVVINKDTIRLMDVHLQSMGIRVGKLLRQDYAEAKEETKSIVRMLKFGFVKRGEEVEVLEKFIEESPYPVMVCGDFNEVPYGYAYGRIHRHLANAFEDAGNGLGFSYNRLPKLIRIDNQFYDDTRLSVQNFVTHQVKFSDHYPISATYSFLKSK